MTTEPNDDATAIDPEMPIVDTHHHLWDGRPIPDENMSKPYRWPDYARDMKRSHNIVQSVAMDCGSHYRIDGPAAMRPVGETEFFAESGRAAGNGMCAGIVSHADLTLGDEVAPVLDAHIAAGDGRFRGIRHMTAWEPGQYCAAEKGLMATEAFRRGFAQLAPRGLSFDAYLYHPQIDELADLARAFPATTIILDHAGGQLGVGRHGENPGETFAAWRASLAALAQLPNVSLKLGGLGSPSTGSSNYGRKPPATTGELVIEWRPTIETAIEAFTPARCLFESNFPVDRATCGYTRLWNVFQTIAAPYSHDERAAMFHGTARRVYRLPLS